MCSHVYARLRVLLRSFYSQTHFAWVLGSARSARPNWDDVTLTRHCHDVALRLRISCSQYCRLAILAITSNYYSALVQPCWCGKIRLSCLLANVSDTLFKFDEAHCSNVFCFVLYVNALVLRVLWDDNQHVWRHVYIYFIACVVWKMTRDQPMARLIIFMVNPDIVVRLMYYVNCGLLWAQTMV